MSADQPMRAERAPTVRGRRQLPGRQSDQAGRGKGAGGVQPSLPGARTLARAVRWLQSVLPEGRRLPKRVWRRRHRGIVALMWLHAVGIVGFGIVRGQSVAHSTLEAAAVAVCAALAAQPRGGRTLRSMMATVGLMTASASLVIGARGSVLKRPALRRRRRPAHDVRQAALDPASPGNGPR